MLRWNSLKKRMDFHLKFILLCIASGIGGGYFSMITTHAYTWFKLLYQAHHYWMLLYIPLMFTGIVFLLKRYFPDATGSGLPQGYALDIYAPSRLHAIYSLRMILGKVILTVLSIGSGASLGREGPTIQICAAIFGSMRNISLKRKKLLIRIGSGVGVAVAFNAPLGGIVFAFEEYIRRSELKMNFLLLAGVVVAGYFGTLVYGDYSYMGHVKVAMLQYSWPTILISIFAGMVCGLIGACFTWIIVYISVDKGQWFHRIRSEHYLLSAVFFGFLVALVGILSQGYSFGNGAVETKSILLSGADLPWYYGVAKWFGVLFSVAAGTPGGYFSTALSIGAGIMDTVYRLCPVVAFEQFYLLGMVGFLSAITQAPITAIAMIISIVGDSQHFMLPLILTSLLSAYIASKFGDSVYQQQVLSFIDKDKYNATR